MLDAQEYLHLAINAAGREDRHVALSYVKHSLDLEPDNQRARYLLATLYADLGLLQRAQTEMAALLSADASLDGVRLVLGKLYLQTGDEISSRKHFVELSSSKEDLMQSYASAMVQLIDGKVEEAKSRFGSILAKVEPSSPMGEEVSRILYRMTLASAVVAPAPIAESQNSELKKPNLNAYARASLG